MAGRMAGQTISDRLLAAKHSLAGQGLAKSACKATTEELIAPKKKHLDYLVHCTNEPNVSIPQLANLLIERSQNTNWVVVYKALITVHHMMCYGNERFTQYLASSNCTFHLSNFLDKGGVQGYDMSPFIRRYARYMNEKAMSYRTVAFDFCKVKRGKEDGMLRTMNADKLLKTLPVLQNQVDALLEFDCSSSDFTNGVINMSFMLLFRDLIKLFACYNDGIINLLEKYFDMNKKQCKEALEIYKRFLIRMDRVGEFLKVAENVGINKGDIPDLTKAPSSLLDALEQHLAHLDGKKGSTQSSAASQSTKNRTNVISGVSALSSTSTSFGSAMANDTTFSTIDEDLKLQVLAEEEAAMNQFKSKVAFHPTPAASAANNPFLDQPLPQESRPSALEIDLLDTEISHMPSSQPFSNHTRVSDDMLQLSNPFSPSAMQSNPLNGGAVPFVLQTNNAWLPNGNVQPSTPTSAFVSENNFAKVFGSAGSAELNSSPFDSLGAVLQPLSSSERNNPQSYNNSSNNNNNINGTNAVNGNTHQNDAKLLTGDLESSLASLVDNLTINPRPVPVKGVQWNSPRRGSKPNNNWTPQPLSATTGAGYKPMNQGLVSPVTNTPPPIYPQMGYRPFAMSMSPTAIPQMSPFGSMSNNPAQMGQQSLLFH